MLNTVQFIKNMILRIWSNKGKVSTSNGLNKRITLLKELNQKMGNSQFV